MSTGSIIRFGALLLVLLLHTGCLRPRCQANTQVFETFVGTEWRLISSTNPATAGNLNKVTFLIVSFDLNYTGRVDLVKNNSRYDTPVSLISSYNVDPDSRILVAQFETVVGQNEQGGWETEPDGAPITYTYRLGTTLTLTETQTGFVYQYVPFTGVVNPDNACSFL